MNYMVKTQLYIFTQNSTLGIQLHVSALYIGHRQVVAYYKLNKQLYNMCVGYASQNKQKIFKSYRNDQQDATV
jgi:hypothetical protein